MMQSHCVLRALRWTTAAVFAYLCAGELLPLPFQLLDMRDWQTQQVVMLTILTSLAVLIGRVGRCTGYSSSFHCDCIVGALHLLTLFNTVPIVIAAIATPLALSSPSAQEPTRRAPGRAVYAGHIPPSIQGSSEGR